MQAGTRVTLTIGRSGRCSIVLDDPSVSRIHAEATVTPNGRVFVVDRNSSHGTYLDRGHGPEPITQQFVALEDLVFFGDARMSGSQLLEQGRRLSAAARRHSPAPPASSESETPRRPRWDSERGEIRDADSRRSR